MRVHLGIKREACRETYILASDKQEKVDHHHCARSLDCKRQDRKGSHGLGYTRHGLGQSRTLEQLKEVTHLKPPRFPDLGAPLNEGHSRGQDAHLRTQRECTCER